MTGGISRSPSFGPALYLGLDKTGSGIIGGVVVGYKKIEDRGDRLSPRVQSTDGLGWGAIEELIDQRCSGVLVRLALVTGLLQCTGLLLKFGGCCFAGIV